MQPDHEQIMAQVKATAEQTREEVTPRPSNPVPNPITSAPAHEGIPTEYVLVVTTQLCDKCGCGETTSQFFARYTTLGRAGTPLVRHLRACARPEYNLPVRRVNNVPSKVPFCSECEDFNLSHLPSPPEPTKLTMPDVLLKGQKAKAPKPEPKKATIDDLI
jgi:hypothetical protein